MERTVIKNETFNDAYRFMSNAFAIPRIENIEFDTCEFNLEYFLMYLFAKNIYVTIRKCNFKSCKLALTDLDVVEHILAFENCNFDQCTFMSKFNRDTKTNIIQYTDCKFNKCNMKEHYPYFKISGGELTDCNFTDFNNISVGITSTISSVLVNCNFQNSICKLNFTDSTLTDVSFKNAQLMSCTFKKNVNSHVLVADNPWPSKINFKNCSFESAQFSNTTFQDMYFTKVVFKNVDFIRESCIFNNVHFGDCALHEVKTLAKVEFRNCKFKLDTAKLHERFGESATRSEAQIEDWKHFFSETEFHNNNTDLAGLDMSGFYFDMTRFSHCNISNIHMTNTMLRQVSFIHCIMNHSNFKDAKNICDPCNYTLDTYTIERDFNSTTFNKSYLISVDFTGAELNCVDFRVNRLANTDFTNAKLKHSLLNMHSGYLPDIYIHDYNILQTELNMPGKFDGADLTNAIFAELTQFNVPLITFNDATIFTGTNLIGTNLRNDQTILQLVARGAVYTEFQHPIQQQQTQQQERAPGQLATRQAGRAMEVHAGFKTFAFLEFINIVTPLLERITLMDSSYNKIMTDINSAKPATKILSAILVLAINLAKKFIATGKIDTQKGAKIKNIEDAIKKAQGCTKPFTYEQLKTFALALKYVYTKAGTFPEFVEAYIDAFISDSQGAYRATNKVTVDTTTEEGSKDTLSCEAGIVERILLSMTNIFLLCKDDGYTKSKAKCDLFPEMAKLHLLFNRADLIENIRTFIGQYKDEWRNAYMRSLLDIQDELADQYGKYIYEIEDEAKLKELKEQLKTFVDAKLKELLTTDDLGNINVGPFRKEYMDFVDNIGQVQLAFNLDTQIKKITAHIQANKDTLTDKYDYAITEISTALRKLLDVDEKYDIPEPILEDFKLSFANFKPKPVVTTTKTNTNTKKRSPGSSSSNRPPAPASPN